MKRRTRLNFEPLEDKALLSALASSLTTNQTTYTAGQPIVMTFQETNVSDHAINVNDGPSIDGFDINQGGRAIWQSNAGINPMFIRLVVLQPGESLTLSATWSGIPSGGSDPVTGSFRVTDQLNPEASATFSITSATPNPTSPPTPTPQPIEVTGPTQPGPVPITTPPAQDPGPPPAQGQGQDPTIPSPTPVPLPTSPAADPPPIAVSVTSAHATDRKGHGLRMTVTLRNNGDSTVTIPKNPGGEFSVLQGSTPVWQRSRNLSGAGTRRLKPGQSIRITEVWTAAARPTGASLTAGTFTLQALTGSPYGSTTFQVDA